MAAPDSKRDRNLCISPEHCGGDLSNAADMRAACDAFFKRRGLNRYGGTKEVAAAGLRGVVGSSVVGGAARKQKQRAGRGVDTCPVG